MTASAVLAGLVAGPALTGVALLAAGRRADRIAGPLAIATSLAAVGLASVAAIDRPRLVVPFIGVVDGGSLGLAVDGLSAVLVVTVTSVSVLVVGFAVADIAKDEARARFFGYLLIFVAAMLATVTAITLPALLFAWEIMGATSYALIAFRWDLPGKLPAGARAFLTTRAGDLGLYVAAGAALAGADSLRHDELAAAEPGWRDLLALGILLAAAGKSAQVPFSAWLSAAMQGPSPVSALLHSATMVAAGGYLLVRLEPVLAGTSWAPTATAWLGGLTALVLGAIACAQQDLKQLLAASTAAQIGFVVLAAGVGATAGGTAQLIAHAAVKAGLFVVAGAWLAALGTKQLAGLRGAGRRFRLLGGSAAVGFVALAGVPPLALWASKEEVLAGIDGAALRVVGLGAVALAAVYAGKALSIVWAVPAPDERSDRGRSAGLRPGGAGIGEQGTAQPPGLTVTVSMVFAIASVALGGLALPGIAESVKELVGGAGEPAPTTGQLMTSGLLAAAILIVVLARPNVARRFERAALVDWGRFGILLTPRPWLVVAVVAARVDDGVFNRTVTALARTVVRLATALRRVDTNRVDGTVNTVAAAAWHLGSIARRPQTGLLHQYYAQAMAGLAVLLFVLLVMR